MKRELRSDQRVRAVQTSTCGHTLGALMPEMLDDSHKPGQPSVRLVSIQNPMIDCERDIGHGTDLYGVGAADLAHDETLFELADSQDGRLRLVDHDGSGQQRA